MPGIEIFGDLDPGIGAPPGIMANCLAIFQIKFLEKSE
jgi:hypothetical protein